MAFELETLILSLIEQVSVDVTVTYRGRHAINGIYVLEIDADFQEAGVSIDRSDLLVFVDTVGTTR